MAKSHAPVAYKQPVNRRKPRTPSNGDTLTGGRRERGEERVHTRERLNDTFIAKPLIIIRKCEVYSIGKFAHSN